ncbi:MAG TPA: hypothetical protein VGE12_18020 [Noviherbaspirillum sp.]
MKNAITCLMLSAALWAGTACAAEPQPKPQAVEVQKDLESIVAACEKKKLPPEQEIECIERGYLEFMGAVPPEES